MVNEKPCSKCGEIKPASEFYLRPNTTSGLRSACIVCEKACDAKRNQTKSAKEYRKKQYLSNYITKRYRAGDFYRTIKRRSKDKGLEFNLTKDWIYSHLKGGCALTRLPFLMVAGRGMSPFSPSIDRIQNDGGYTKDNCRMILQGINALKGSGTDADIKYIVWRLNQYFFGHSHAHVHVDQEVFYGI